jgi:hypothetical protein
METEENGFRVGKQKQCKKLLSSQVHGTDSDIQRFGELKEYLRTEYEILNGTKLTDAETVRRIIYELWKIKIRAKS